MIGGEREVVKLCLGQGQPALNVLPVGLDGETLTLVCPFPVLPLEVPVNVTLPGEEDAGPVPAVIRRIGVELAGDSEIPRFKLHLALDPRSHDASDDGPIVVHDESSHAGHDLGALEADVTDRIGGDPVRDEDKAPDAESASSPAVETEDDDVSVEWHQKIEWPGLHEMETLERAQGPDELSSADDASPDFDDPPWAISEFDPPHAEEIPEPRQSRWTVRLGVTLALLASVFAVGYVTRQPLASLLAPLIGQELAYTSLGLSQPGHAVPRLEELEITTAPAVAATPAAPLVEEAASAPQDDSAADPAEPVDLAPAAPAEETAEESVATEDDAAAEDAAEPADGPVAPAEEAAAASTGSDPTVEQSEDTLRIVLPTQWPVTSATSYRLHDPTGIVIDVPGAMAAERARWIDTSNERVRSVRVLEREDGVRFIIYLNDEVVPRYRVGYSRLGVLVDILGPDSRHRTTK
jgi:hypothetical protein